MPNTLLTPNIIAREAILALESNLVMADLVHRDYSSEFVKVGDTVNVRKPASFVAKNFTGEIEKQDITEGSVPVKLDRYRDVSVDVTSKEWTLDVKDFSMQVIQPAMKAIAEGVDIDLLNVAAKITNSVASSANPANLSDIGQLAKKLDLTKTPRANRRLVLHPEHLYKYALTDNLSKVAYAGDNVTLRDALLGRVYSLDTYYDQNAPASAAATPGTATALSVTGTKNGTTFAATGVTPATATIKTGDIIILDGVSYGVTTDVTASGGAASITVDTKLIKDYGTATSAYIVTAPHSLAFHRNAIALVSRPLDLPHGGVEAAVADYNGLGVRVTYGYNQNTKTETVSFDIIYGVALLEPKMAVKLVG
jgi:hypothetical protein